MDGVLECWVGMREGVEVSFGKCYWEARGVVVEVGEGEGRGGEGSNLSISRLQKTSKISLTHASLSLRCLISSSKIL